MERSGLELLLAMVSGEIALPPIARTIGFRLTEVSEGKAVFECPIGEHLLNPFGVVHGGVALTLVDSAAACAVQTRLKPGIGYASIETKVNFTRGIPRDAGVATATGRVVSLGRRIATAEALVCGSDGAILAHGTSTIMLFE